MSFARKGTKRWLWLVAMISVFALLIAACGDDDDDDDDGGGDSPEPGFTTVTIEAGQPIKIGISSALTGDAAGLGVPIADAIRVAGEGVDIEGFEIEFIEKDELCTADGGQSAATALIAEGVVSVVGPICSGAVVAAQPDYEAAGITHVSPSSTAILSTAPARGSIFTTFFRVTYNDSIQGPAQAEFALDTLGATTAYVVYDTDAYGSGLRDAFSEAFEDGGGEIVGSPEGYEKGATDFQSIITNIQSEAPDLIYFAGFYAEATTFLTQLRATDEETPFLGGDGVKNDELLAGAGEAAEGAYLSLPSPVLEGDVYETFREKWEAAYGSDATTVTYGAEAYDAATVVIEAIRRAAVLEDGNLVIDLERVNEEVAATDMVGAIGPIKFDEKGDNAGGAVPVTLFQVVDGEFVSLD